MTAAIRLDEPEAVAIAVKALCDVKAIARDLGNFDGIYVPFATAEYCQDASARTLTLLAGVEEIVTAQHRVIGALNEDLRGLRDEGLAMAREITDARRDRARLVEIIDRMRHNTAARLEALSAESAVLEEIHTQLVPREFMRPMGVSPDRHLSLVGDRR